MASLSALAVLFDQRTPPCVSLYQPIYRSPPEQSQNAVRFANLVTQIGETLRERYQRARANEVLASLTRLRESPDFLLPTSDGLAVFASPDFVQVMRLPKSVQEVAQVSDSFFVRPLIRVLQAADRFQLLGVSAGRVRVFDGHRDFVIEVPDGDGVPRTRREALPEEYTDPTLPPGVAPDSREGFGGPVIHAAQRSRLDNHDTDVLRFYRVVDEAMIQRYSRPSQLPLVLVALPENQAMFRSVSGNPFLLEEGVAADPLAFSPREMLEHAWPLFEQRHQQQLDNLRERFGTARSHQRGDDDLEQVATAAAMSRVDTLLLEEGRNEFGRFDAVDGRVVRDPTATDDLYDELAELVLRRGGKVLVLTSDQMPTASGLAAIYRF
ncbi:MAG: hypothetical protein AB7F89_11645 [Pirellulaceae bacterium]